MDRWIYVTRQNEDQIILTQISDVRLYDGAGLKGSNINSNSKVPKGSFVIQVPLKKE